MPSGVYAVRRIQFCAGHRVVGHEGKCKTPHGHNYIVELTASVKGGQDDIGRVVDFSVLKETIGEWIERHWDHKFLVWEDDAAVIQALRKFREECEFEQALMPFAEGSEDDSIMFLLPYNPTAENIGRYILETVAPGLLPNGVILEHVLVRETPNCYAEVFRQGE